MKANNKNVKMTAKQAITLISMLESRINQNNDDILNAPLLMHMTEEKEENVLFQSIIDNLDRTFWTKNGELK